MSMKSLMEMEGLEQRLAWVLWQDMLLEQINLTIFDLHFLFNYFIEEKPRANEILNHLLHTTCTM